LLNLAHQISFNHATFGPEASFDTFLKAVASSGAKGVGVWTERLDGLTPKAAGDRIHDLGLEISGVNRGGFFTGTPNGRHHAIEETKRQIEMTAEMGAQTLVIVPGGLSVDTRNIDDARAMVTDGLGAVADFARAHSVQLALEPFNPALSAARGDVNTLDLALDMCEPHANHVGVVTDIFHVWWDPGVLRAIERAGPRIFGHHLCDWKLDTVDPFADRGVMGDGVADVPGLTAAVINAGYRGWMEVEIFSRNHLWVMEAEAIATLCLQKAITCLEDAERRCSVRVSSRV
jgi:sugar phosphate isomerase/epimerase